jgi:hypothetical protein
MRCAEWGPPLRAKAVPSVLGAWLPSPSQHPGDSQQQQQQKKYICLVEKKLVGRGDLVLKFGEPLAQGLLVFLQRLQVLLQGFLDLLGLLQYLLGFLQRLLAFVEGRGLFGYPLDVPPVLCG